MARFSSFFAVLLLFTAAAGCSGSESTAEAREDPDDVAGEQRTVLRGTAMREQSAMGSDLLETLRAANQNARAATSQPAPHRFNTLVTALEEAGLAEMLTSEDPYTIFAPTDDAFRKLSTARLEALLKPENSGKLRRLLRYHLVDANLVADELAQRSPVGTLAERPLRVEGEDEGITVNGAQVLQADAGASNGTIHVIDTVLLPPSLR